MTMGAKAFLDTHVLLRATIERMPFYPEAKQLLFEQQEKQIELWISRQILREYIAYVTRPQTFMQPLTIEEITKRLTSFAATFRIADETASVTTQLLMLLKEHSTGGKQVHDANVVATMLAYGIDTLLTTNLKDMNRFANKIKIILLETNTDDHAH
jgi:predicted nucleic acid-binding protein